MTYSEIIPVLVEALKEEKSRADAATKEEDARINALQEQIATLQGLVEQLRGTNLSLPAEPLKREPPAAP